MSQNDTDMAQDPTVAYGVNSYADVLFFLHYVRINGQRLGESHAKFTPEACLDVMRRYCN